MLHQTANGNNLMSNDSKTKRTQYVQNMFNNFYLHCVLGPHQLLIHNRRFRLLLVHLEVIGRVRQIDVDDVSGRCVAGSLLRWR